LLPPDSLLGKSDVKLENPKAHLIRTAANLWIDRVRRSAREQAVMVLERAEPTSTLPHEPADGSRAAKALFQALHPQERTAVLMNDVLDLSLEETAAMRPSAGPQNRRAVSVRKLWNHEGSVFGCRLWRIGRRRGAKLF
jgi:hypothetical protein